MTSVTATVKVGGVFGLAVCLCDSHADLGLASGHTAHACMGNVYRERSFVTAPQATQDSLHNLTTLEIGDSHIHRDCLPICPWWWMNLHELAVTQRYHKMQGN